jgi:hypothetical protein
MEIPYTVEVRQYQIEDHQIRRAADDHVQCFLSIRGLLHAIPFGLEATSQREPDTRLIVGD